MFCLNTVGTLTSTLKASQCIMGLYDVDHSISSPQQLHTPVTNVHKLITVFLHKINTLRHNDACRCNTEYMTGTPVPQLWNYV